MRGSLRLAGLLASALLALSLTTAGFAQRAQRRVPLLPAAWAKKLSLTADQQAKVKDADTAYQADRQSALALSTPKEQRAAQRTAREKADGVLRGILTDDQKKQLDGLQASAKEYRDLGGIGNSLAVLDLTADQKTRIHDIATKYQPDLAKLRADLKGSADKQALQAQIREQEDKRTAEVRAVLTPEQQQQIQPPARRKKKAA